MLDPSKETHHLLLEAACLASSRFPATSSAFRPKPNLATTRHLATIFYSSCLRCITLYQAHLRWSTASSPFGGLFVLLSAHAAAHFLIFYFVQLADLRGTRFLFRPVPSPIPGGHIGDVDLAVALAHRQLFLRIRSSGPLRPSPFPCYNMAGVELAGRFGYWIFQDPLFLSTRYTTHASHNQKNGGGTTSQCAHDELMRLTTFLLSLFSLSLASTSRFAGF